VGFQDDVTESIKALRKGEPGLSVKAIADHAVLLGVLHTDDPEEGVTRLRELLYQLDDMDIPGAAEDARALRAALAVDFPQHKNVSARRKAARDSQVFIGSERAQFTAEDRALTRLVSLILKPDARPAAVEAPASPDSRPKGKRRLFTVITAATIAAVPAAYGVLYVAQGSHGHARRPEVASTMPVRLASVKHTLNKGLFSHVEPNTTSPRGPVFLKENDVIGVLCQERHGQGVSDPGNPKQGNKLSWPVWDKLSTGVWISDLYTDLPVTPGETTPPGIPRCGR
jgi:hypothetical protein